MNKNQKNKLEKLPFEEALAKLEGIVEKMEAGDLPLEKMITCYEDGTQLSRICAGKLKALEKKIELLVKDTPDGGEWEDFDKTDASLTEVEGPEKEQEKNKTDLLF